MPGDYLDKDEDDLSLKAHPLLIHTYVGLIY